MKSLIAQRRLVAEGRVATPRIVPALDVVKQRPAGRGRGREPLAVEQFAFQRREEALAEGIVVGVSDRPHRGPHTEGQTTLPVGDGGVLTAVIRMMDDALGPPLRQSHIQRGEH